MRAGVMEKFGIDGKSIYYRNGVRKFYNGKATIPGVLNSLPPVSPLALADFLQAEVTLTAMAITARLGSVKEAKKRHTGLVPLPRPRWA